MCNLEISLRGLTTLVKLNDYEWRVVLPNAMRPTVSRLDPNCIIEEHYPNIALEDCAIPEQSRECANFKGRLQFDDMAHQPRPAGMSSSEPLFKASPFYDVFLTPYHEIKIHGITGPDLHVCDDYVADPSKPPASLDRVPLRYTADLRKIPTAPLRVKRGVMIGNPPLDLVAAYLDLDYGEICAKSLIPQDMYTFINSGQGSTPQQLLAFEILIKLELGDEAWIELRDRRVRKPDCVPDDLRIDLITDSETPIRMVIDNAPLEDILAIRSQVGTEPSFSGEPFYHFEVIHNLLEVPDPRTNIVLPIAPEYRYAPHLCPPHTRCVPSSTLGGSTSTDPAAGQ